MSLKGKANAFFRLPKLCAKDSKRPVLIETADCLACYLKYGAGFTDYFVFKFYNKSSAQRKQFICKRTNDRLVTKLNDKIYTVIFSDKREFDKTFSEFIGRDILDLTAASADDIKLFMARHTVAIQKPAISISGKGIVKVTSSDSASDIKSRGGLLEQFVIQHKRLSGLYSQSVNTLRLVTIIKNNTPYITAAALRIGNGGIVDNAGAGGLCASVSVETGQVITDAVDLFTNTSYKEHPLTGKAFKGFQIPYFNQCKSMVLKAALVVPQVKYVGWDVAVTESGPLLIEANHNPGYQLYQAPEDKGYSEIFKYYI